MDALQAAARGDRHKMGYRKLHPVEGLDFALNRWLPYMREAEVAEAATRIASLDDWRREFTRLAELAEQECRPLNGAFYYCAAEFFLGRDSAVRAGLMDRSLRLYDEVIRDWGAERHDVPYESGALPALVLRAKGRRLDTLVVHGGFDSYKEELFMAAPDYAAMGFDVIVFDGPGQGQALRRHGLVMPSDWERPVGAVLSHFGLTDCTLMGFSLGGYLAPRAAAYDDRIKRLIVNDVLFDFFAVFANRMPAAAALALEAALDAHDGGTVNAIVEGLAATSDVIRWALAHGVEVSGAKDYVDYFRWLRKMTTAEFSHRITQDVLVLAAKEDHIVPMRQFYQQVEALTDVSSLTAQVFTRADHAHQHCHVANTAMVIDFVGTWLRFQNRLASDRMNLP
ncbi:MAG TPA: alpha/beta fold hydrolase [Vineibacter sp.]|nr:alpha/beta fold hydrolase [Vineibacter sp.]